MTDTATETPAGLSAVEVCAMAEITYRNLDYWVRRGYIDLDPDHVGLPTPGSGVPRRFTPREAKRFTVLALLVRAGLRVDVAADTLRRLEASSFARPVDLADAVQISIDRKYWYA